MGLSMIAAFCLFDVIALLVGFFIGYTVSKSFLLASVIRIQGELIDLQSLNVRLSSDLVSMKGEIAELRGQIRREEASNRHMRANIIQATMAMKEGENGVELAVRDLVRGFGGWLEAG